MFQILDLRQHDQSYISVQVNSNRWYARTFGNNTIDDREKQHDREKASFAKARGMYSIEVFLHARL